MTEKPLPHSIPLSDLSKAVEAAVAHATQQHSGFQFKPGIIMGRWLETAVVKGTPATHAAATTHVDAHQEVAAEITKQVAAQTHLNLEPQVLKIDPNHLILGFVYRPAFEQK